MLKPSLLTCGVALIVASVPAAAIEPLKETFTGTVIQVGGSLSGKSVPITIQINGVTTDAEAASYRQILTEQKQDGLQRAISKNDLGFVAISGQTGTRINVVRIKDTPQGRSYTILLERLIGIAEARHSGRSLDYPFALLRMTIKADGKGEGKAIGMAKIKMKKDNTIEVENYGTYPANLVGLQKR